MNAYDIDILKRPVDRADPADIGWCFGLPPGIAPEQWPLDPANGYPLVHGFTMLLPEDYRCHGPELVALSFFGTPFDMNDGGPETEQHIAAAFNIGAEEPSDRDLKVFWESEQRRHPRLSRMKDSLDCSCAVILLTRGEFEGPLCQPPEVRPNLYRDRTGPPGWLQFGAASAVVRTGYYPDTLDVLGGVPEDDLAYNRAARLQLRQDPNAGKAPRDRSDPEQTNYQHPFYMTDLGETGTHEWGKHLIWMHIGGTMQPGQNMPHFSPYYIEFEQYFGGFNFGDGTAQLDFKAMKCNVMVP